MSAVMRAWERVATVLRVRADLRAQLDTIVAESADAQCRLRMAVAGTLFTEEAVAWLRVQNPGQPLSKEFLVEALAQLCGDIVLAAGMDLADPTPTPTVDESPSRH